MRPISATIDLSALRHNLRAVRAHAPASKAFAVIKANAYGHGLLRAARAFADAAGFAVVELDAAVRLREAGYAQRIVLLEGFFEPDELQVLTDYRIDPVIHSEEQLRMLESWKASAALDVLLKINTGMNRLGLAAAQWRAAAEKLKRTRTEEAR